MSGDNFESDMNWAMSMTSGKDAQAASAHATEMGKRAEEFRAANERLKLQVVMLQTQIEGLKSENARLMAQADVDAAHAVGVAAQTKALFVEIDNCPNKDSHPLAEKKQFINGVTGKPEVGRAAREIYRAAFDQEAEARGVEDFVHMRK